MNQNPNIDRNHNHHSPERKHRGASPRVKIAAIALSLAMGLGTFAACKEIGKNNSESGKESFYPNGGLPFAELVDFSKFTESEDTVNGGSKYEYSNGAKEISLSFETLDDDEVFVLDEGGSIRSADVSANPEKLSTILLSGEAVVFDKVKKVGHYNTTNGDSYLLIESDETPPAVEAYIDKNEVGLSTLKGEEYVFINTLDGKIVSAESVKETEVVTPIGDVSLAA